MIAAQGERTESLESDAPVLLIAFSPTLLQREESSPKPSLLKQGEVLWITSRNLFRITSIDGKAAGHLLQISFRPDDR
jgi:hypothetical protein